MTGHELDKMERAAWWITYHAREVRDVMLLAKNRPDWRTVMQAELQRAKDELTDALEMIAEAQRDYDDLPATPMLEAAE